MMKQDLVQRAKAFALQRHANMCRPNKDKQPCIEHLEEVAFLAEEAGVSSYGRAASWLHDSIEDTETTKEEIRMHFGEIVASLVEDLTDPQSFKNLPLLQRKEQQAAHFVGKNREVLLIKLSDQISNVLSVEKDPPLDWDDKKSLDYILGAKKIATVCKGKSKFLDEMFEKAFNEAHQKYGLCNKTNSAEYINDIF